MPPAVGENIPTAGGLTIYRGITLLFRSLNRRSLNNKLHASIHSICLTTVRSISAFIRIQRLNPIQYISQIILKGTLQLAGTLFFKLLRTVSQFFRPIGQLVNTINNLAASRFQIRSSACQRRSSICQCRSSARQRRCSACRFLSFRCLQKVLQIHRLTGFPAVQDLRSAVSCRPAES